MIVRRLFFLLCTRRLQEKKKACQSEFPLLSSHHPYQDGLLYLCSRSAVSETRISKSSLTSNTHVQLWPRHMQSDAPTGTRRICRRAQIDSFPQCSLTAHTLLIPGRKEVHGPVWTCMYPERRERVPVQIRCVVIISFAEPLSLPLFLFHRSQAAMAWWIPHTRILRSTRTSLHGRRHPCRVQSTPGDCRGACVVWTG